MVNTDIIYTCLLIKSYIHAWAFTWPGWSQAVRGSAGADASDDAVKQETDLFSFWAGQEENSGPWKTDGTETESRPAISDKENYMMDDSTTDMMKQGGIFFKSQTKKQR